MPHRLWHGKRHYPGGWQARTSFRAGHGGAGLFLQAPTSGSSSEPRLGPDTAAMGAEGSAGQTSGGVRPCLTHHGQPRQGLSRPGESFVWAPRARGLATVPEMRPVGPAFLTAPRCTERGSVPLRAGPPAHQQPDGPSWPASRSANTLRAHVQQGRLRALTSGWALRHTQQSRARRLEAASAAPAPRPGPSAAPGSVTCGAAPGSTPAALVAAPAGRGAPAAAAHLAHAPSQPF